jgi:hypothetical protein
MFPLHGSIGIVLILLGELLMFFRMEPYSTYLFYILLWLGYILVVDAWVFSKTKKSRLKTNPIAFWLLFVISALFWWFYEILNIFVLNWRYEGVGQPEWLMFTIAFSTVLPAVFETMDLLKGYGWFSKLKWKLNVTSRHLSWIFFAGILCLIFPFVLPLYTYPLIWLSMFFLLDPINYLNKKSSIIGELKKGKPQLLLVLMVGTLICGFFWEFWNFWAPAKWFYDVPFVGFLKVFEMPLLGYLGYMPFGLSLYAMYHFFIGLFKK